MPVNRRNFHSSSVHFLAVSAYCLVDGRRDRIARPLVGLHLTSNTFVEGESSFIVCVREIRYPHFVSHRFCSRRLSAAHASTQSWLEGPMPYCVGQWPIDRRGRASPRQSCVWQCGRNLRRRSAIFRALPVSLPRQYLVRSLIPRAAQARCRANSVKHSTTADSVAVFSFAGSRSPLAAQARICEAISVVIDDLRFASGSVATALSRTAFISLISSS
jgi:hypothetical protein